MRRSPLTRGSRCRGLLDMWDQVVEQSRAGLVQFRWWWSPSTHPHQVAIAIA